MPEIGALPTRIGCVDELPAQVDGLPVFGIAEDTLAPRGFEPDRLCSSITGPPQSGTTNALRALIIAVERFDPTVKLFHFGSRRSELKDFRDWVRSATRPEDEKDLATELAELVVERVAGRAAS